ncbi:hypothetical protein CIHG_09842 [Coccidioides immitis H538.4]|uniref:Uncharacterized protein n=2 Tax=Coccidioides immitis TaxID=5501 RepID=A0A0J8TZA6_COCIT|nr:hypothetical protein CISG_07823 [Coccidioides immitis RMSCC 3703]KMU92034.1 hypothetical protein CIHG_09842 [Coccidioides immitis H538.4]
MINKRQLTPVGYGMASSTEDNGSEQSSEESIPSSTTGPTEDGNSTEIVSPSEEAAVSYLISPSAEMLAAVASNNIDVSHQHQCISENLAPTNISPTEPLQVAQHNIPAVPVLIPRPWRC